MASGATIVKCQGRFNELRDYFYQEALPCILTDDNHINRQNLRDIWDLAGADLATGGFDRTDPYFFCNAYGKDGKIKGTDDLRMTPEIGYLSLVPLLEGHMDIEGGLVFDYANTSMGNSRIVSEKLELITNRSDNYLKDIGKASKDIVIQNRTNLSGYRVSGNFGIGSLCEGGLNGGGVRSDSPFLLEVYHNDRNGSNLAAVVGFWAQNDEMILSQMQPCKNADMPKDVPFGVACYRVAEAAADAIGFKKLRSYSARNHPLFKQHPSSWGQMESLFVQLWDSSGKKLGYGGGRTENHSKDF
jgi:hypothetical protein